MRRTCIPRIAACNCPDNTARRVHVRSLIVAARLTHSLYPGRFFQRAFNIVQCRIACCDQIRSLGGPGTAHGN